jgi:hypothetical protein
MYFSATFRMGDAEVSDFEFWTPTVNSRTFFRHPLLKTQQPGMAPIKKKTQKPSTGSGKMTLKRVKGENFYRDAKAASRVKMLNGGKPVRDKDGKIIVAAAFQKGEDETKPGRVQPDRRWFGMDENLIDSEVAS